MKITPAQYDILKSIAIDLSVSPDTLYKMIDHESGWNSTIKNPLAKSSATGLIQLTNKAAQDIGYKTSASAIAINPSIEAQLRYVVHPWLKKYAPYKSDADLLLQVFYPLARHMHAMDSLPADIKAQNPGIVTPYDYVVKVLKYPRLAIAAFEKEKNSIVPIVLLAIVTVFLIFKKG